MFKHYKLYTYLIIILFAGCTRSITFQIVDANTKAPLAGVKANSIGRGYDRFFGETHQDKTYPMTDETGLVIATGLRTWPYHSFNFEKQGYNPATAGYSARNNTAIWVSPISKSGQHDAVIDVKGIVVIPMYPIDSTTQKSP